MSGRCVWLKAPFLDSFDRLAFQAEAEREGRVLFHNFLAEPQLWRQSTTLKEFCPDTP
jgi:hypothetical protein